MSGIALGTQVRMNGKSGSEFDGRIGTVVGLSLWKSYETGDGMGDRLIEFHDNGKTERGYFESWMMVPLVSLVKRLVSLMKNSPEQVAAFDEVEREAMIVEEILAEDNKRMGRVELNRDFAWALYNRMVNGNSRGLPTTPLQRGLSYI